MRKVSCPRVVHQLSTSLHSRSRAGCDPLRLPALYEDVVDVADPLVADKGTTLGLDRDFPQTKREEALRP